MSELRRPGLQGVQAGANDERDRELLRLLLEDARRPCSEFAEHVELSPPAVSDRIDRLTELGIIRRFTADVDRSRLREGIRLLVTFDADVGRAGDLRAALDDVDVAPIVSDDWNPAVDEATIGLECVECGNTVTSEGVSAEIGGERYEFCCQSCLGRFETRYEELDDDI